MSLPVLTPEEVYKRVHDLLTRAAQYVHDPSEGTPQTGYETVRHRLAREMGDLDRELKCTIKGHDHPPMENPMCRRCGVTDKTIEYRRNNPT